MFLLRSEYLIFKRDPTDPPPQKKKETWPKNRQFQAKILKHVSASIWQNTKGDDLRI